MPTPAGASRTREVTDETLRSGPPRLLAFLEGVADPETRLLLTSEAGWSERHCAEGIRLLNELTAFSARPVVAVAHDRPDLIAACEQLRGNMLRARARLELASPRHATSLFEDYNRGLARQELALATLQVMTRIAALAKDQGIGDAAEAHRAALLALDETGLGPAQLRAFFREVEAVKSHRDERACRELAARAEADAGRRAVLKKIHAWVTTWSTIARTVVRRRDQLIRLGIARRRARTSATSRDALAVRDA